VSVTGMAIGNTNPANEAFGYFINIYLGKNTLVRSKKFLKTLKRY